MRLGKGFLRSAAEDEEPGGEDPLEEQYEKLFPKIGRDFVYRGDFERIILEVLSTVDPFGLRPINVSSDIAARMKALEYKQILDSGQDGSELYQDLIDLDDD